MESSTREKKREVGKEVWKMKAIFAFVPDDMLGKEEAIPLLRCAFVQYVDQNTYTTDIVHMHRRINTQSLW